jgi:hypothetical protein
MIISSPEYVFPSSIPKNRLKKIMAVPSFMRDSPIIRVVSFGLAPALFKIDTTATGSVAETIDPKIKHSFQSQAGITSIVKPAVREVLMTTPGTASKKHCQKVVCT